MLIRLNEELWPLVQIGSETIKPTGFTLFSTMTGNQLPQPVLILLLLLLPSDASAAAEPQYLLLVPSHLYSGVPEQACVILNYLNETVTLNVTLMYEMKSRPLLTDRENISVSVKFRIVSVDVNFHPVDEMFPVVYIEDPKGDRIFQWQSLKLETGLSQLSFPLSVEPFLGFYKIILQQMSGENIKHSFEGKSFDPDLQIPKWENQMAMPWNVNRTGGMKLNQYRLKAEERTTSMDNRSETHKSSSPEEDRLDEKMCYNVVHQKINKGDPKDSKFGAWEMEMPLTRILS
ncbi:hypothetical protein P7K49_019239 [Saguinus oedipus]|uniref:Macroglobulin domain-containing protein n=1 Tax=Saguinus oedipus TaxID=9490 RepID=A0ABQ9UYL5_SAGOE|nr:hypothetical protein P7K49_019239 [Saguinus oedipus]